MVDLDQLFIESDDHRVMYEGQVLCRIHRIPVHKQQVFRVTFVESKSKFDQGISIRIKGQLAMHGAHPNADERNSRIILWKKTAPKESEWVVEQGDCIEVWSAWDIGHRGSEAWYGNAGMIHTDEDGAHVFRCSDGPGDVDFGNLVFKIELL